MLNKWLMGLILVFVGCGKLVEIPGNINTRSDFNFPDKPIDVDVKTDIPDDITIGPNMAGAGDYCDRRYGVGTAASEECFQDYMSYFDVDIGFDLDALVEYCESRYGTNEAIEACVEDLASIFDSFGMPEEQEVFSE